MSRQLAVFLSVELSSCKDRKANSKVSNPSPKSVGASGSVLAETVVVGEVEPRERRRLRARTAALPRPLPPSSLPTSHAHLLAPGTAPRSGTKRDPEGGVHKTVRAP